jgi:hypothetical protein
MLKLEKRTEDDMRESGWTEAQIEERVSDQEARPSLYENQDND